MRRVKTENMSLLTALDKTERLVYKTNGVAINASGVTHHHLHHPIGKENSHPQVTQSKTYSWEKKTDNGLRNTWHSSSSSSNNHHNHNTYSSNSELLSGIAGIASTGSNTARGLSPSLGSNRRLHRVNALATRGTVSSNAKAISVSTIHSSHTLI